MDSEEPHFSACFGCTVSCLRQHGTSRESMQGGTFYPDSFYTRVSEHCVEGGPSCWMQVPQSFVQKCLLHVDRRPMLLENADGKAWSVVYTAEHGFHSGWGEFSTANQLAIDDWLLFGMVQPEKLVVHVFNRAGKEKHLPTDTPQANATRGTRMATHSHVANPAPASERFPLGSTRPADSGERNESRAKWDGFRTSAPQRNSYSVTLERVNTSQTNQIDPNWQPEPAMSSKDRPATSDTYDVLPEPPPRTKLTTPATHSRAANPVPASERFTRPAYSGTRNKSRAELDGFRTPAPQRNSYGVTLERVNTLQTNQSDPDWQPEPDMSSKGSPASSDTYKFQKLSAPPPRTNLTRPSWRGDAGPSTCHSLQLGRQGDLREKKRERAMWRLIPTWSQIQAKLLVARAKLRKLNITPSPMSNSKRQRVLRRNRNPVKKRTFIECSESDGDIGFDASVSYDDWRPHGQRKRRSFSKDGAVNVSSVNSIFRGEIQTGGANIRRWPGVYLRPHEKSDSFDKIPEYMPKYVQLPRKAGGPRKNATLPKNPPQQRTWPTLPESSNGVHAMAVPEKRRRGRPFKHQVPGEYDVIAKPVREIFVSRRRSVTKAEKDEVVNAAYAYASHLKSSTNFVVVMRQSFVYRNFVLGVPRRFAHRYMPSASVEVTLVDEAWEAWTCTWNAAYKYMSGRGWRNFAIEHCIEEDDALLMEILAETEDTLTIMVRIFRVVAIPDGQTGWTSHVMPPQCYPELNSGVPIQPMLQAPGKRQPRMRALSPKPAPARRKRVKREPFYIEESTTSDSSEEFD